MCLSKTAAPKNPIGQHFQYFTSYSSSDCSTGGSCSSNLKTGAGGKHSQSALLSTPATKID